jgi:hypothetical protein
MTQAPESKRHRPAGGVVVATRLLTLFIAAAMGDLSAQGEQQAAKFGLTLVTVGTLLLTPDALKVLVKLGAIRRPGWLGWNSLSRVYQGVLIALVVVAVGGVAFGIARQVAEGSLDETSTVIYLVGVAALSALMLIGLLPWWLITSAQDIAGGPDELREGSKKLSMSARMLLGHIEARGWPTLMGGLLFLVGTGVQFAAIALS